ncbi:MAG: hypothetical protein WEC33_07700 [Dehalococcoidia bacterium]
MALIAAGGFLLVSGFQAALALGAPWGRAAWGGADDELSTGLRAASGFAVLVWIGAALLVLRRAAWWGEARQSGLVKGATWLLSAMLVLGVIANAASSSPWERFGWAPVTFVLMLVTAAVARSDEGR